MAIGLAHLPNLNESAEPLLPAATRIAISRRQSACGGVMGNWCGAGERFSIEPPIELQNINYTDDEESIRRSIRPPETPFGSQTPQGEEPSYYVRDKMVNTSGKDPLLEQPHGAITKISSDHELNPLKNY